MIENKFRVLHVIDSLRVGGAESQLYYFLEVAAREPSFDFQVCTLFPGGYYKKKIEELGIKVYSLNQSRKYSLVGIAKLINIVKEGNYDIIHVHLFPASAYIAVVATILPKTRIVYTEHSETNRRRALAPLRGIDNLQYKQFDRILAVGESTMKALREWLPTLENITLVENAVPVEKIHNYGLNIRKKNESEDIDVLFIGRLIKAKGVDVLLDALKYLETEFGDPISACIVGTGPEERRYRDYARKIGLLSTRFVGYQENIYQWMGRSKMLVLPSRWEGLPMTLLEGMAFGTPIICTPAGAMGGVIANGKNGLLVPIEDVKGLGSAISSLLQDKAMRESLSAEAYRYVLNRYDVRRLKDQLLNIYRELISDSDLDVLSSS